MLLLGGEMKRCFSFASSSYTMKGDLERYSTTFFAESDVSGHVPERDRYYGKEDANSLILKHGGCCYNRLVAKRKERFCGRWNERARGGK